jgi:hypothetical protein
MIMMSILIWYQGHLVFRKTILLKVFMPLVTIDLRSFLNFVSLTSTIRLLNSLPGWLTPLLQTVC